jgi:hypothetical protein
MDDPRVSDQWPGALQSRTSSLWCRKILGPQTPGTPAPPRRANANLQFDNLARLRS